MKILLINGSPKCGQSDTLQITNAFIDGMNDVCDCEVRSIEAVKLNIGYCTGCLSCMNSGRCVLDDDMTDVLSAFAGSDLILMSELALPMIPTQTYADICSMNAKQNAQ